MKKNEGTKRKIVLLGPPGAGKGTHAKDLAAEFKISHISTGDILREAVKQGTEVGKLAKSYMDRGELVPDDVIARVVLERVQKQDCINGFILDGYPRTLPQAELLEKGLRGIGSGLDVAVEVTADPAVVVSRLALRRICKKCGAIFHLKNIPPKVSGKCDFCQGDLYQRDDDQEQTVLRRLEVYKEQSQPLVDYYHKKGLLKTVDGGLPREEAFRQLLDTIESVA